MAAARPPYETCFFTCLSYCYDILGFDITCDKICWRLCSFLSSSTGGLEEPTGPGNTLTAVRRRTHGVFPAFSASGTGNLYLESRYPKHHKSFTLEPVFAASSAGNGLMLTSLERPVLEDHDRSHGRDNGSSGSLLRYDGFMISNAAVSDIGGGVLWYDGSVGSGQCSAMSGSAVSGLMSQAYRFDGLPY